MGSLMPTATTHRPRVLIIVQNLPVPFDRRVWLECMALVEAGYDVSVVCPKGDGDPDYAVLDDVALYKYRPYAPGGGALSFMFEYAYSFLATAWQVRRARRRGRFDVVQACNPPDIFWPIGRWLRLRDGSRFVFDHHDLCPELFDSRFAAGHPVLRRGLVALERATFHTADQVISTNESYAKVAVRRGGRAPSQVTVVRTGPDPARLRRAEPEPAHRRGRRYLVAYIGVMGPQDGVDVAMRAAGHVVNGMGRTDIGYVFMGAGDSHDELVALRSELGLDDYVEMPGRVPDQTVVEVLSTADVGLSPDPKNPLNNVSTMNKTMEYMAFELPVLAFDLDETRVSAQEAAVYVTEHTPEAYARALVALIDDPATRAARGSVGRARVEAVLGWPHQRAAYVSVYDRLTRRATAPARGQEPDVVIDLRDQVRVPSPGLPSPATPGGLGVPAPSRPGRPDERSATAGNPE
jgi:glycosyltransferase involved in cell wall biosynthesis